MSNEFPITSKFVRPQVFNCGSDIILCHKFHRNSDDRLFIDSGTHF
jgi:hypothetical protein